MCKMNYVGAKIGFDTAENGPSKVVRQPFIKTVGGRPTRTHSAPTDQRIIVFSIVTARIQRIFKVQKEF